MKLQRVVFVLVGMMFLFAGTSPAQQVKTDYDRDVNFAQYKTYSWDRLRPRMRWISIESRVRSMPPWRQRVGPRWIRAATFRS